MLHLCPLSSSMPSTGIQNSGGACTDKSDEGPSKDMETGQECTDMGADRETDARQISQSVSPLVCMGKPGCVEVTEISVERLL